MSEEIINKIIKLLDEMKYFAHTGATSAYVTSHSGALKLLEQLRVKTNE